MKPYAEMSDKLISVLFPEPQQQTIKQLGATDQQVIDGIRQLDKGTTLRITTKDKKTHYLFCEIIDQYYKSIFNNPGNPGGFDQLNPNSFIGIEQDIEQDIVDSICKSSTLVMTDILSTAPEGYIRWIRDDLLSLLEQK